MCIKSKLNKSTMAFPTASDIHDIILTQASLLMLALAIINGTRRHLVNEVHILTWYVCYVFPFLCSVVILRFDRDHYQFIEGDTVELVVTKSAPLDTEINS